MPTNKTYQDVQLFIDFSKDITGATKLADSVLYSNLESSGQQTNSNLAISLAKIYTWANDVFTFNPSASGTTPKITINSAVLPVDTDTTYSFREGTTKGSFQVQENDEAWQTIGVYQVGTDLGHGDGLTATEPPDKIYLIDRAGTNISNTTIGLLDPVLSGQTVVGWKIKESLLPSYVDDVIEAYYDNGDFYSDPTTHTSATKITPESGKIYVDITTNASYRWGGSTYVKISNPVDVMVGASASANGVAGLVPAPLIGDQTKFLRGDATWVTIATTDTTYALSGITYNSDNTKQVVTLTPSSGTETYADIEPMVGATSSAAGKAGLVPKPATGNRSQYLRGDGSWATPTNTDTKVNVTLATTTKLFLLGCSETPTSTAQAVESKADTGVYLTTTAGTLHATNFDGKINNHTVNADVPSGAVFTDTWIAMTGATSSADGTVGYVNAAPPSDGYNTKYLRADGTWAVPPGTYTHPTYTARTGKPTANQTPAFGETFTISQIKSDSTGHVTNAVDRTVKIPDSLFTMTAAGGAKGLVPGADSDTDTGKYLRSDATWNDPVEDFRTKVNDETFTLVLHCTNGRTSS